MAIATKLDAGRPVRVLAFTPTPTHPTIQGNRQRVFDICRAMQSMGADITLLYYATEGLSADDARRMKDVWTNVEVVFPRGFLPQHTLARYPAIDDWYDDSIGVAAARLHAERNFDVCIANYAWYSKIFESLPRNVIRVIDTHDVFGGRAERFSELDLAPQWFHTSVAEESKGLDRADLVLAIQEIEAETLAQRTNSQVLTIGFLSAPDFLPIPPRMAARRLKVGYIGSANPFNVSSIQSLGRALRSASHSAAAFDVCLAGPVCAAIPPSQRFFTLLGIVDSAADFYRSVDVVVNPMLGGTGLKIKSLEALGYGKPLVATQDAMTGIPSDHEGHMLADVEGIVGKLQSLAETPERLADEAAISRKVFTSYRNSQLEAFLRFWSRIEEDVATRRATRKITRKLETS